MGSGSRGGDGFSEGGLRWVSRVIRGGAFQLRIAESAYCCTGCYGGGRQVDWRTGNREWVGRMLTVLCDIIN